jgi:hypothetical protein
MPWIEGARMERSDAKDASLLRRIGNYIFDAAQPGLTGSQNRIAIERLAEMLRWNTKESLGEVFAEKTSALKDAALAAFTPLSYGDGHLAPQEWIRTGEGKIFKLDAEGHSADHTAIGEQSLLWDIAGAWIEWNLDPQTAAPLMETLEERGVRVDFEALTFYRTAFAAFRVGLFSMALAQVSGERERKRFAAARAFYLKKLVEVLTPEAMVAQSAG